MKKALILLLSILIFSCEKDEELTNINGDGSGGMSCVMNGTILNPSGGGIGGNKTCRIDYFPDEQVYFFAVGFSTDQFDFTSVSAIAYDIDLDNLVGETFDLIGMDTAENDESYGRVTKGNFNVEGRNYSTNSVRIGTMTILHYDNDEYTISGTFEFEAENEFGEIITITDGRFDSGLGY
jgi:hypothetical protein